MAIPNNMKDKLTIPVIGAPLFLVSGPDLVIAQCKAGIVGSFPALNARPQHVLDEWIVRIKKELAEYQEQNPDAKVAPFAVNQICHASNDRLMQDMETCVKHEVPIIITSLRPPSEVVEAAHSYGGLVFHDVINVRHAQKAAEQGVDGLILVCAGAGGHAGALSPFALVREVQEWFDGTVILSGSIGDGHSVASAIALGADFAYLGTRFIATEEANADQEYKKMLEESAASDIVYSSLFTGVLGNYLKPSIKQTILEDYVREYYEENDKNTCILIIITLTSINDTIQKTIRQLWEKFNEYVILFDIPNLLINILEHKYVPEHIKLTHEKKEEVYNQYNILDDKQVPQISAFDPVAKCILLKPGEMCKINRFNKISFNSELDY